MVTKNELKTFKIAEKINFFVTVYILRDNIYHAKSNKNQ